jgi:hypothetical protein
MGGYPDLYNHLLGGNQRMSTTRNIEAGWKCQKSTRCLEPIFKEWTNCIAEIAHNWKSRRDAPWWYNERASLSVFAGAVWRAGGVCFEEYCDEKRTRKTHCFGKCYPGRVDLGFSRNGSDFIAEAKATWHCFGRTEREGAGDRVRHNLESACDDVRLTRPSGRRRFGIVFARPVFKKRFKAQIDGNLGRWVEMLAGFETNAYAWAFPSCARYLYSEDGYYCPGEALLIREVRR